MPSTLDPADLDSSEASARPGIWGALFAGLTIFWVVVGWAAWAFSN